ncbi:hypothetical protein sos41_31540 [Alphaproteobacteria bacterium SO-S41]|nr:hypothetical protein sos41_31540 [Alphaproteobacteria bacterium SO-S41]
MRTATIQAIFEEAARLSPEHVTFTELVGGKQGAITTRVRDRGILAIRTLRPDLSLQRIGSAISKDHSSVLVAARRAQERLKTDDAELRAFDQLLAGFPPMAFDDVAADEKLAAAETLLMDALNAVRVARNALATTKAVTL